MWRILFKQFELIKLKKKKSFTRITDATFIYFLQTKWGRVKNKRGLEADLDNTL